LQKAEKQEEQQTKHKGEIFREFVVVQKMRTTTINYIFKSEIFT
jgi:hypothetical protein